MSKAKARAKAPTARKPWSKEDFRLLKSMARKEPLAKIADALKRTAGATRQKRLIALSQVRLNVVSSPC